VLQVLIFPRPHLYFLCWIAVAPLIVAILRARETDAAELLSSENPSFLAPGSVRQGFVLGYASGVVWYLGSCYWVYHVMHTYGGLNPVISFLLLVAFALYLGLYHGIFGAALALAGQARTGFSRKALVLAPFIWVAVELARCYITGFPWDLLGTVQVDNVPLARIATMTGVYGLSFEIVLVNSAFAAAFLVGARKRKNMLVAGLTAAVALQAGRWLKIEDYNPRLTATLVQQNIPLKEGTWDYDYYDRTLRELAQLSIPPQRPDGAGLIVWPESPAPFFLNDGRFMETISGIAKARNSYLVAGALGARAAAATQQAPEDLFNSAVLIGPDGNVQSRYDKVHLVPFGEYVPFRNLLSFAKSLTAEVGNFVPGGDRIPLIVNNKPAGVFICYESVFPNEIRMFAARGAQVFINISNDGWFGMTGAPEQHLNMARMRAIENGRWLLRATNTGITASIDPLGRVVAVAPRNQRTTLQAPYSYVEEVTFYTHYGDWFPIGCAIISIVGLFVRSRTRAEMVEPQPV
jgi:apolipoprotein N-acyltransferase